MHRALQHKALETSGSLSEIVDDAVRQALAKDAEDLAAFEDPLSESGASQKTLALPGAKAHRPRAIPHTSGELPHHLFNPGLRADCMGG